MCNATLRATCPQKEFTNVYLYAPDLLNTLCGLRMESDTYHVINSIMSQCTLNSRREW